MSDILIVEDEAVLARSMQSFLERRGFTVDHAVDAASARALFKRESPRLVILDYKLNRDDGLELLGWFREADPRVQVVMLTGHGDIDLAVRAMKGGAADFMVKPTPLAAIASIAGELMLGEMQGGLDRVGTDRIVGRSAVAAAIRATVRKLARPGAPARPGVLIMGPEGAGKSLTAQALHETAAPGEPMVAVDCALGVDDFDAAIAAAGQGSLILRHTCALPVEGQQGLLRALHRRADPPALIATADRDLSMVPGFVPDLLYRIQVGWIDVPALSERAADVLPLAELFARRMARDRGETRPRFTPAARARLLEHDWPGNVAELENCIARAMLLRQDAEIAADMIRPIGVDAPSDDIPNLVDMERDAITRALSRTRGNVSRAASLLGISRDTLRYRMEKFALPRQ